MKILINVKSILFEKIDSGYKFNENLLNFLD